MILLANLLVMACLIGMGFGLKAILSAWGTGVYFAFCAGVFVGVTLYQVAHRLRYGHWFDGPVINGDMSGPDERAPNINLPGKRF